MFAWQCATWAQKKTLPPPVDRERERHSFAEVLARASPPNVIVEESEKAKMMQEFEQRHGPLPRM